MFLVTPAIVSYRLVSHDKKQCILRLLKVLWEQ